MTATLTEPDDLTYLDFLKEKVQWPPTADWLRQKYIEERLSMVDIGRIVERDTKTVLYWMRRFEIPTRPRGTANPENHFKTGEPSAHTGYRHSEETKEVIRQSTIADGRVPYLRDGQHWLTGANPSDNPNWKGGITPERQAFSNSIDWKLATKDVRIRDRVCRRCKVRPASRGPRHLRGHIHHIVSFAVVELRLVRSNLVLLCCGCHHWVHSNGNADGEFLDSIEAAP